MDISFALGFIAHYQHPFSHGVGQALADQRVFSYFEGMGFGLFLFYAAACSPPCSAGSLLLLLTAMPMFTASQSIRRQSAILESDAGNLLQHTHYDTDNRSLALRLLARARKCRVAPAVRLVGTQLSFTTVLQNP